MLSLANPTIFLGVARRILPWAWGLTLLLFAVGLTMAFRAPPDYQQGETVKIMYLHVPAAWLSTFIYGVMTLAALGTLVWRHPARRRGAERRRRRSARVSPSSAWSPARCGASRCGARIGCGTRG